MAKLVLLDIGGECVWGGGGGGGGVESFKDVMPSFYIVEAEFLSS